MPAALALKQCACDGCNETFVPQSSRHTFCSDRCRWRQRERHDPSHIANNRRRNARWSALHRAVKQSNPWLLGAPPFEEYLPGGGLEIFFEPHMVFEHRHLSALHGVITSITGPHDRNVPNFVLVPWPRGCGWGVYLRSGEQARELARTRHNMRLGSGRTTLRFGDLNRIRAPRVTKRGHRRLRIDAVTPVCVRCTQGCDGTQKLYTAPTSGNLRSTLALMTPKRLGLLVDESSVKLEMLSRETIPATFSLAGRDGRLGNMRGWTGHVIVDCNAVAHWLLLVAERIGYGGTTSFGFGRIRVTDI